MRKTKENELYQRNGDRIERWFAEIWNSTEKFPISLNSPGPHGGPVWEWLGWSRKTSAWRKYQGTIPTSDYALLADDGRLHQSVQAPPGLAFDVLLTANGFDHALLGAPREHWWGCCPGTFARRLCSGSTPAAPMPGRHGGQGCSG